MTPFDYDAMIAERAGGMKYVLSFLIGAGIGFSVFMIAFWLVS